jgi:hypothetical protein
MAETLISPGVLARENDQSFITSQPVTVGAAIIGPTVKGPGAGPAPQGAPLWRVATRRLATSLRTEVPSPPTWSQRSCGSQHVETTSTHCR